MSMQIEIVQWNDREIDRFETEERSLGMCLTPVQLEIGSYKKATSRYDFASGDIFLTPFQSELWVRPQSSSFIVATLSRESIQTACGRKAETELQCRKHMRDVRVGSLMRCLEAEAAAAFPSGRLFLDSVELALASILVGKEPQVPRADSLASKGLPPRKLRKVVEFVHENLEKDISLQQLAGAVDMSVSYFSEMFRAATGSTPHRFLLKTRLDRARDLLLGSELSVLHVAMSCGFKTSQHFAKAFRDYSSMSPSQFRQQ